MCIRDRASAESPRGTTQPQRTPRGRGDPRRREPRAPSNQGGVRNRGSDSQTRKLSEVSAHAPSRN
eukprot:1729644-Alexandrium_andersonii.AAC.1